MAVLDIIIGAFLLTLGRKFFWFFVAATGFYAGLEISSRFLHNTPGWVAFVIAIVIGLTGALLAYFAQKLAIGAAGFLAGAFIGSRLVTLFGAQLQGKNWDWVIILVGGIIGISLMLVIFEWALIFLSSFAGAILVVNGLNLVGLFGILVGIVLFIVGLSFQSNLHHREGSRKPSSS